MEFILVAVLLVAVAIGLVYFMGKKGKSTGQKSSQQQATPQQPQSSGSPQQPPQSTSHQ